MDEWGQWEAVLHLDGPIIDRLWVLAVNKCQSVCVYLV
jgi:hypothetical protein